ncbi:MAG TPA: hypothetical protein DEQ28_06495 [Clostridiales bacterium]|nr:hypothetical protein [Clostridiales bacterium]
MADRPVLLVNPFPGQSFYGVMVEHLGLAYLVAVLRNHGFEVAVREFQGGQCSGSHGRRRAGAGWRDGGSMPWIDRTRGVPVSVAKTRRRAAPLGTEPILALPFRA